ncbi:hypothetical protein FOZ63_028754 [Perkinsus olseni]|uniref:Uncharacterized protein n=1 Tax=Perkinsus olseni TaxID=32597 RepID=A0A7J6PYE4_PEROL|nr:hypothetical protein FOZ63_028754 [Perkinsus olseni]
MNHWMMLVPTSPPSLRSTKTSIGISEAPDSDIVTPKSPDPRVAGAADDTYALSIDTNIGTRQGPSESVDLVKRIEENARQAAASRQGAAMFASGVLPMFNPARPHKNLSERVGLSTPS